MSAGDLIDDDGMTFVSANVFSGKEREPSSIAIGNKESNIACFLSINSDRDDFGSSDDAHRAVSDIGRKRFDSFNPP